MKKSNFKKPIIKKIFHSFFALTLIFNMTFLGLIVDVDGVNANSGGSNSGGSGAIWTTNSDCGEDDQNINHYKTGDNIYINGSGFAPNTEYAWYITPLPDDKNPNVAYGSYETDNNGEFCFFAYEVTSDDKGQHSAKFGNKNDNFGVNTGNDTINTGSITLNKTTIPAGDSQEFDFSLTGATSSTVSLADQGSKDWDGLAEGAYIITEIPVVGWSIEDIYCDDSISYSTKGNIIEINLDEGENADCTFVNKKDQELTPQIDLELTKEAENSDSKVNAGATTSFELVLTNNGPDKATDISVLDILPEGLTFVSASPQTGEFSTTDWKWNINELLFGSSTQLIIVVEVNEGTEGQTIVNTATTTASEEDVNEDNNVASASIAVNENDNYCEIYVVEGDDRYASSVVNHNQGLQYNGQPVKVARSVPEQGLKFEAGQSESNFFSLGFGGWIIVEFDYPIFNGTGTDLKIIEDTWGGGYPLEKAEVWVSQYNNGDWEYLGIADNTNLNIIHTTSEFDLPASWEWAKYVKIVDISVKSHFNKLSKSARDAADGYDLNAVEALYSAICEEQPLKGSITINKITNPADSQSFAFTSNSLTPSSVDLSNGDSKTWPGLVKGDYIIEETEVGGWSIKDIYCDNSTSYSTTSNSIEINLDEGENADCTFVNKKDQELTPQIDLELTKEVESSKVNAGATTSFELVLTNNGPDKATDITVLDILPSGLTFISATPKTGEFSSSTWMWTIDELANEASTQLFMIVKVNEETEGLTITNIATTTTASEEDVEDVNEDNNVASASIAVNEDDNPNPPTPPSPPSGGTSGFSSSILPCFLDGTCGQETASDVVVLGETGEPYLTITKTVSLEFANPGDTVEFTVMVTNNGNLSAFDVVLEDTLPDGFTYVNEPNWFLGDIESGKSKIIAYSVLISDNVEAKNYISPVKADSVNHDTIVAQADLDVLEVLVLGVESPQLPETGFRFYEMFLLLALATVSLSISSSLKKQKVKA